MRTIKDVLDEAGKYGNIDPETHVALCKELDELVYRRCDEPGPSLSDFERVVLEYIAFNAGFINTRVRARELLDGRLGEREETKPAGPADQAVYQAIADNYARDLDREGGERQLSDYREALRDTLLALQSADCSELSPALEGKVRIARALLSKGV